MSRGLTVSVLGVSVSRCLGISVSQRLRVFVLGVEQGRCSRPNSTWLRDAARYSVEEDSTHEQHTGYQTLAPVLVPGPGGQARLLTLQHASWRLLRIPLHQFHAASPHEEKC